MCFAARRNLALATLTCALKAVADAGRDEAIQGWAFRSLVK
jgi:hypothetical protein